jgi:AraC-like DNA-binding protein
VAIEFWDNFFRFGAIASWLWCASLLLRFFPGVMQARLAAIAAISVSCFLIISRYDETEIFGPFLSTIILFVAELNPGLTWLFCLSMFKDNFRLKLMHWAVMFIYVISAVLFVFDMLPDTETTTFSRLLRVVIYCHLVYVIVADRNEDLIEERRSFRLWFVGAVVAATAFISVAEVSFSDFYSLGYGSISQAAVVFVISLFMLSHITHVSDGVFFAQIDNSETASSLSKNKDQALDATDQHSIAELEAKMQAGAYKEAGLTIADLASQLRVPEHRLRRLINNHLGHRNFSQYLNTYRIEEAKKQLAVVKDRHVPVLTIAMDLGYQSLGPFNRAFKSRTGQTPTEYRNTQLSDKE